MRIDVSEDGCIDGYLSVSEYASEIGVTTGNVRTMIQRGQIKPLVIRVGEGKSQRFNFIKAGTPKPTVSYRRSENDH